MKNRLFVTLFAITALAVSLAACGQKENNPVEENIAGIEDNSSTEVTPSSEIATATPVITEEPEVTPVETPDAADDAKEAVSDGTEDTTDTTEETPTVENVDVIDTTFENVAGFWTEKLNVNLNDYDYSEGDSDDNIVLVITEDGFFTTITQSWFWEIYPDWLGRTESDEYIYIKRFMKTDGSNSLTYTGYELDDNSTICNGQYRDSFGDLLGTVDSVEGNPDLAPVVSFQFVTVEALSDGTIRYTNETEEGTTTQIFYRAEY